MAILQLQKLKDLWGRHPEIIDEESHEYKRAKAIFRALDKLDEMKPINPWGEAKPHGPDDGARKAVRSDYDEQTGNDNLRKAILSNVYKICPGLLSDETKNALFFLTSNIPNNDFEGKGISPGRPSYMQSYFLSWNHPSAVAQYLAGCIDNVEWKWWRKGQDDNICHNRFPMKYLWMLKTKDVIPILSLQSFYNLEQVFLDLEPNFKEQFNYFANHPDRWEQPLEDFEERWTELSKKLCGKLEIDLEKDNQREEFAKFMFYVSLTDNISKDAKTMLEHGNHAIILYGPPGTGKTYRAKQIACQMLGIEFDPKNEPMFRISSGENGYNYTINGESPDQDSKGMYQVIQFHPNYSYQDFIGGIFPNTDNGQIVYEKKEGIFQILCKLAEKNKGNRKKFILIIDEINRANLSAVFGELMYCLEYRNRKVEIPLFGSFSIPDNVYIIGTMNNTDKSLIGFDLALRRRFGFVKVMPEMRVLDTLDLDYSAVLKEKAEDLNKKLIGQLKLSKDKQIGHAYFMKIKEFATKIDKEDSPESADGSCEYEYKLTPYALEQLWDYHISPLLEEYLGMEFEDKEEDIKKIKDAFIAQWEVEN